MKRKINASKILVACAFAFAFGAVAYAASEAINSSPMGTGSSVSAKPNLMYLMDNSGSMNFGFLPDYVGDYNGCAPSGNYTTGGTPTCFTSTAADNSLLDFTSSSLASFVGPLSSYFNSMYYNPNLTYTPPKYFDPATSGAIPFPAANPTAAYVHPLTSVASNTGVTAANIDSLAKGSAVMGTDLINLKTSFPNFKFCSSSNNDTGLAAGACITHDNTNTGTGITTNNTGGNTTKTNNFSTGIFVNGNSTANGKNVWPGTYDQPVQYLGAPYYYDHEASSSNVVFCTAATIANVKAAIVANPTLADSYNILSTSNDCQAKADDTHSTPFWAGVLTKGNAEVAGTSTLTVTGVGGDTGYSPLTASGTVGLTYTLPKASITVNLAINTTTSSTTVQNYMAAKETITSTWATTGGTNSFTYVSQPGSFKTFANQSGTLGSWTYIVSKKNNTTATITISPKAGTSLIGLDMASVAVNGKIPFTMAAGSPFTAASPNFTCPTTGTASATTTCTVDISRTFGVGEVSTTYTDSFTIGNASLTNVATVTTTNGTSTAVTASAATNLSNFVGAVKAIPASGFTVSSTGGAITYSNSFGGTATVTTAVSNLSNMAGTASGAIITYTAPAIPTPTSTVAGTSTTTNVPLTATITEQGYLATNTGTVISTAAYTDATSLANAIIAAYSAASVTIGGSTVPLNSVVTLGLTSNATKQTNVLNASCVGSTACSTVSFSVSGTQKDNCNSKYGDACQNGILGTNAWGTSWSGLGTAGAGSSSGSGSSNFAIFVTEFPKDPTFNWTGTCAVPTGNMTTDAACIAAGIASPTLVAPTGSSAKNASNSTSALSAPKTCGQNTTSTTCDIYYTNATNSPKAQFKSGTQTTIATLSTPYIQVAKGTMTSGVTETLSQTVYNPDTVTFGITSYPTQSVFNVDITIAAPGHPTQTSFVWHVTAFPVAVGNVAANYNAVASAIAAAINNSNGFKATASGATVTITSPTGIPNATAPVNLTVNSWTTASSQPGTISATNPSVTITANPAPFSGYVAFKADVTTTGPTFAKKIIDSAHADNSPGSADGTASFNRPSTRTDCGTATAGVVKCTVTVEMQNFANWFSYYRNRLSSMKSSASLALAPITDTTPGNGWKLGLMLSNTSETGNVGQAFASGEIESKVFTQANKGNFYKKLMGVTADPSSQTPLREMVSRAGWYYANKIPGAADPMEYACQINASFLSTDGYWNSNGGYKLSTASGTAISSLGASTMPDQDGKTTPYNLKFNPYPFYDSSSSSNTLADVAMHYHDTDLRPDFADVAPVDSSGMANQKMILYALSFGVGGTLNYDPNYLAGSSADYNALIAGTKNWPTPAANKMSAIDDLWHATVNGRGQFFNSAYPDQVAGAFSTAINKIGTIVGAASAAATSSLEPVAGDNFAYVANYRTSVWDGDLQAYEIDLNPSSSTYGHLTPNKMWSANDNLNNLMGYSGTTFKTAKDNGRKIFTANPTTGAYFAITDWPTVYANTTLRNYFDPALLSQCPSGAGCGTFSSTSSDLFEYLMGRQQGTTAYFRERTNAMGDIVNSQPIYVKGSPFSYSSATDPGFTAYKTSAPVSTRASTVYVGANDGFLHAFNATTGTELWAYAPKATLPYLHRLADTNYSHTNFVDGVISIGDVQTDRSLATSWKTLLVTGLGNGGALSYGGKTYGNNAYVALDVTDPTDPKPMWEFSDPDLGKTFGNPVITKVCTANCSSSTVDPTYKWAVIVANGYNPPSGASGILYVLDAGTGTELFRITTSGSANSGLNKINNWVDNATLDNTSHTVYGGDDDGNMWRFNLDTHTADKMAALGSSKPISTMPQLGLVNGHKGVFFGTGRFVTIADASGTDLQSIYGIKDTYNASATPALTALTETDLIQRVLTPGTIANTRTMAASSHIIDWNTDNGWFINLQDSAGAAATGERVNVDPKLQLGIFTVASNVPKTGGTGADACLFGGYSWINMIDIATGTTAINPSANPNSIVSDRRETGSSLTVGIAVIKLPDGKIKTLITTSNNQHPVLDEFTSVTTSSPKRVSWRDMSLN